MTHQRRGSRRGGAVLATDPHHDGSPLYVPSPPTQVGEAFDVLLRAPAAAGVTRVVVRQVHDGEPAPVAATVDSIDPDGTTWWRATLTQANPVVTYRFLTDAGPLRYRWITAAGPVDHDPTDARDFRSSVFPGGPSWLAGALAYQIFPDRFARSGRVRLPLPDWAIPAEWDELPIWSGPGTGRHFFGGDLYGVAEHLDHLQNLGVTLIYLTPVFPAPSNHRYNASSFEHVDPLLGGDEAYADLIAAAHARGIRVIGDFTTNHTGSTHEWFTAAQADADAPEAGYYFFDEHPDDYVGWFGVRSLPKVNHADAGLRERMITGPDSPLRRFLRPPFKADGWRIDVANMTGRHRDTDLAREVARDVRATVLAEQPEAYLVGEHFHDYRDDLPGDGWQGVMNYAGFTKPLWSWLTDGTQPVDNWLGLPWQGWPRLPGESVVAAMREFTAVPWQHLLSSMVLIGSHDSPRIATVVGDQQLVEVALGALMTYPGVPVIWAGDEVGLTGRTGEDGRRPMPWDRPETWDAATLSAVRALAGVRAGSPALQRGSLRWCFADADRIVYARELPGEVVLVLLSRAAGDGISLPTSAVGLHDGLECANLYGNAPVVASGGKVMLPGGGPTVQIWRWSSPSSAGDVATESGGSRWPRWS